MRLINDSQTVVRYVLTYVNKNGMRTLADPCHGRYTFPTKEKAEAALQNLLLTNNQEALKAFFGDVSKMEVRPCQCWAGHFDPVGVWFD